MDLYEKINKKMSKVDKNKDDNIIKFSPLF